MMNQYSFPGRAERSCTGRDRSPYRSRTARGIYPTGSGGLGCGCGIGGRLPTNRDMKGDRAFESCSENTCGQTKDMPRTGTCCHIKDRTSSLCSNDNGGYSYGQDRYDRMLNSSCGCESNHAHSAHSSDGGCGCNHSDGESRGNRRDCDKLMQQIRAVDFALYEVILYLDVYPHSCDALETYHKLLADSKALHRAYESTVGPITAFGNESTTAWDWMKKPFPWEYDAE